jgi:hypothetical protein
MENFKLKFFSFISVISFDSFNTLTEVNYWEK